MQFHLQHKLSSKHLPGSKPTRLAVSIANFPFLFCSTFFNIYKFCVFVGYFVLVDLQQSLCCCKKLFYIKKCIITNHSKLKKGKTLREKSSFADSRASQLSPSPSSSTCLMTGIPGNNRKRNHQSDIPSNKLLLICALTM